MATTNWYVCTDYTGGSEDGTKSTPYSSVQAAETAKQGTIGSGDEVIIHCRGTTADSTLAISGWTLTGDLTVKAYEGSDSWYSGDSGSVNSGFNSDATSEYSTSHHRLVNTNYLVTISDTGNVTISLMQGQMTHTTSTRAGVWATTARTGGTVTVNGCRIHSTKAGAYNIGIWGQDTDSSYVAQNNLIWDATEGIDSGGDMLAYNNTVSGNSSYGLRGTGASNWTIRNNAIFDNTDDLSDATSGTWDPDYCAIDDADSQSNGQDASPGTPESDGWDAMFVDRAGGDYTPSDSGVLAANGVGPSSDGNVPTTDPFGTSRSGTTCDIGWIERSAGGTTTSDVPLASQTLTPQAPTTLRSLISNIPVHA